ncbi:MAG TPA: adenylate kinase [Candidatus Polarisedimenticolia bacterium]|nr:adenylate kinase [Candidatus Polarisedimenticolia bacterium]
MRLVLLGPPGAGKGTQAAAIRERYRIPHISTGDMLRSAIAAGSPVGRRAKGMVDAGQLVPDDMMAEMVRERLAADDAAEGFLLDGYPRNVEQGTTLDEILASMGAALDHALLLELEDAEIIRRLSGRRSCPACGAPYHVTAAPPRQAGQCDRCGGPEGKLSQRPDDREEIVAERLRVYRERTAPLADFFRGRKLLRVIDASGTVGDVERRIMTVLASPSLAGGHGARAGRS